MEYYCSALLHVLQNCLGEEIQDSFIRWQHKIAKQSKFRIISTDSNVGIKTNQMQSSNKQVCVFPKEIP